VPKAGQPVRSRTGQDSSGAGGLDHEPEGPFGLIRLLAALWWKRPLETIGLNYFGGTQGRNVSRNEAGGPPHMSLTAMMGESITDLAIGVVIEPALPPNVDEGIQRLSAPFRA